MTDPITAHDEAVAYIESLELPPAPAGARDEALAYAATLRGRGYDADVWHFKTALGGSADGRIATGYAVEVTRASDRDGSLWFGLAVLCEDSQLPVTRLVAAGRALVHYTGGVSSGLEPWYVAGHNPRRTPLQRDPDVNPGTLPVAWLAPIAPDAHDDGPHRFYLLRLTRVTLAGMPVDSDGNIVRAGAPNPWL